MKKESHVYSAKPKCCLAKSPEWETLTKICLVAAATAPGDSSHSAQDLCYTPGESGGGGEDGESLLRKHFMTVKLYISNPFPWTKEAQATYMVLFLSLF